MLSVFVWPTATSTITAAGDWFNPLIQEFWTPISWGLGIIIFGALVGLIFNYFRK